MVLALIALLTATDTARYCYKHPKETKVELLLLAAPSHSRCLRIIGQKQTIINYASDQVVKGRWDWDVVNYLDLCYNGWECLNSAYCRGFCAAVREYYYYQAREFFLGKK